MNCSWTEKVSLLIDGELVPDELTEVERHLIGCGECQQVRADFLNFRSQLSSYEPFLSPVSTDDPLARILATTERPLLKQPARRFAFGSLFNPRVAAFAAILLAALLIAIVAYRNLRHAEKNTYQAHNSTPIATSEVPQQSPARPSPVDPGNKPKASKPNAGKLGTSKPLPKLETPAFTFNEPRPASAPSDTVADAQPAATASTAAPVRSGDSETLTAMHFEKAELLLRAFRNVRLSEPGVGVEVGYEKRKAQQLIYQNMMLRREADATGDVQVSSLLENLEPILIDIANLPDKPGDDDIRVIRDRVEKKNIVALLQVNSAALARALD